MCLSIGGLAPEAALGWLEPSALENYSDAKQWVNVHPFAPLACERASWQHCWCRVGHGLPGEDLGASGPARGSVWWRELRDDHINRGALQCIHDCKRDPCYGSTRSAGCPGLFRCNEGVHACGHNAELERPSQGRGARVRLRPTAQLARTTRQTVHHPPSSRSGC
jgi:hypothetical protein